MSSLQGEILEDILGRWTIDAAQFTTRRFLHVVTERFADICLRQIAYASFRAPNENENTDATAVVRIDGPPERVLSEALALSGDSPPKRPAMSSLPSEVLEDVLLPLDRWALDDVQFVNRRFLHLITERMWDVCLRQVTHASFWASEENETNWTSFISIFRASTGNDTNGTSFIRIDGRPERKAVLPVHGLDKDTPCLFTEFVQALRSAHVEDLALSGLVFTPGLAALVLQTPIFTGTLSLHYGNYAQLTPTLFRKVIMHFSPTSLEINTCELRACQITDELLRALSKNRVRSTKFYNPVPVDGDRFAVTDDALVELCVQEDDPIGPGYAPFRQLVVSNGSFTKDLFKRLVEASTVSARTQPLYIDVSPSPVEVEDLRDFAQHLSYSRRGEWNQLRIYTFPAERHAAHLQIVLHSDNRLEIIRARRPNLSFYKSDE